MEAVEARLAAEQAEVRRLLIALNHVGRGLQMVDAHGYVVLANDMAAELVGVPAEFLASKPHVNDVVALQWQSDEFAKTSEPLRDRFHAPMAMSKMERYRRLRPNGRMVEVESIPLAGGGLVRIHTDVTERHEDEQRIAHLARHDYLTGLYNRATFQETLEQALRAEGGTVLMLVDVDRFKDINDAFGHPVGDAVLIELAARLQENVLASDVVARFGGDEFALLLRRHLEPAEIEALAARLTAAAVKPFVIAGKQCVSGISIGIATSSPNTRYASVETNRDEILRRADLALYAAKSAGRSNWRSFDPALQAQHLAEQRMLRELQTAISAGQFEVFYQPLIDTASGRVSAFEALVRWRHPSRGLLVAGDFIPCAETSGLIVQIGEWVLRQACHDAACWPPEVRVLVNLSPRQLGSVGLFDAVKDALVTSGLEPARLEIEITETSLLQMSHAMGALMGSLRALGIRIALDDFGTGYSSLSHLRQFTFDTVKIDRSFVVEATTRPGSRAIVRAVTGLAAELGLGTIAEGVETQEQSALLQAMGCKELQGFLFSPARPADELGALMDRLNDRHVSGGVQVVER